MRDEWTLSLCVVVEVGDEKKMLLRSADVANGILAPFERGNDFAEENRELIFPPRTASLLEGDTALWKWKSDNNGWITSEKEKRTRWIEYINYEEVYSLDDIMGKLLVGVEITPDERDFLFEYEHMFNGTRCCLYIPGRFFIENPNGKMTLKEDVFFLDICRIDEKDILYLSTRRVPSLSIRYYRYLNPPERMDSVAFRPADAIVKDVILKRISTYMPNAFGKSEKKTIREFLSFILNSTLASDVAAKCGCSIEIAEAYVATFMNSCESYLACEDFDARLLARLVDSDAELTQKFRELVQSAWEQESSQRIMDAEAALANLKEQCSGMEVQHNSLVSTCAELASSKTELESAVSALQQQYRSQLNNADSVADQVRAKIADAQNDIVGFFSQYAMYTAQTAVVPEASSKTSQIQPGKKVSDSPEYLKGNRELIEALRENLEIVGVVRDRTHALAAYLLAAHATRTPLVLAGYGATLLLDALSATLINKTTTIVYQPQNQEADIVCGLPSTDVVALFEAFHATALCRILSPQVPPYICLIAATSEELSIEPKSFYNYAIPVFTDFFVDSVMDGDLEGSRSNLKLPIRSNNRLVSLPDNSLPLLAISRCKELLGTASAIANTNLTAYDIFLLQTIPVMLSLGKRTELLDLISESGCSDQEKKQLHGLVGDNND